MENKYEHNGYFYYREGIKEEIKDENRGKEVKVLRTKEIGEANVFYVYKEALDFINRHISGFGFVKTFYKE